MPATKVQLIGGNFQDNEGNVLALGYLILRLSSDEQVPGVGQIAAGISTRINLNSSGSVDTLTPQLVWGNDQMVPANNFYIVEGYTAAGELAWGPNNEQAIGSGGTFDVGTWVPNTVLSWFYPAAVGPTGPAGSNGVTGPTGAGAGSLYTSTPAWWGSYDGGLYGFSTQLAGQLGTTVANQVKVSMVRLPFDVKVSKVSMLINATGGATGAAGYGYYTPAGNKVFSWDNIDVSTGGIKQITLGSPVTLSAGIYFVAAGLNNTSAAASQCGYEGGHSSEGIEPWNVFGTKRAGTVANPMVGNAMPATLGLISIGGGGFNVLPYYFMEP